MASHFKHSELRKMRHQRKPAKVRVGKASAPVPDIPLQEPILITDAGEVLALGPRQGDGTRPSHRPWSGAWGERASERHGCSSDPSSARAALRSGSWGEGSCV